MKNDTRGKKEETKKEIEVLDQGVDMDDIVSPRSVCCHVAVFAFRG